jgi:hypothetical protein
MPTTISGGTPYTSSAIASHFSLALQNATPARMRIGSTKRARYAAQFFAVPAGGGMMKRATFGWKRACSSAPRTHAGSRPCRSASASAKSITSARRP